MALIATQLRWPPNLREAVLAAALANRCSMNSEILNRLDASFAAKQPTNRAPDQPQENAA